MKHFMVNPEMPGWTPEETAVYPGLTDFPYCPESAHLAATVSRSVS